MSLTINYYSAIDDDALGKIFNRLDKIEELIMSIADEQAAKVAQLIDIVKNDTNVLSAVKVLNDKIFAEVQSLVANSGAVVPGLDELIAAVTANSAELVSAVAKGTEIDGLIPDAPAV